MNRRDLIKAGVATLLAGAAMPQIAGAVATNVPSMTLLEMADAVAENEPLRAALIEQMAANPLLSRLHFKTAAGGKYSYGHTPPRPGDKVENLKIVGGDLDVDLAAIKQHGPELISIEQRRYARERGLLVQSMAINGDTDRDPRQLNGLKKRAILATNLGSGLSKAELDETIDGVPGANALIMSKKMRNLLSAHTTNPGILPIVWDKDAFGTRVANYEYDGKLLPILVMEDRGEQYPSPIDFNEGPAGEGEGVFTSIYVARLGDDGVFGVQHDIPGIEGLGEVQEIPVDRTRIEWLVALATDEKKGPAIARLTSIAQGPVRA